MSINEALRSVCPSLSVKIALGVGLFNNALLAMGKNAVIHFIFKSFPSIFFVFFRNFPLGTERHNKYYEAAWEGKV